MAFTVFLANRTGEREDAFTNTVTVLSSYFRRIVQDTHLEFSGVRIINDIGQFNATDLDLLCYLVPSGIDGVASTFHGGGDLGPELGITKFSTGSHREAVSEVYWIDIQRDFSDAQTGLAKLIFHELMHNKALMGNRLHTVGGGGLASDGIGNGTDITTENIAFMRSKMNNRVRQWSGGFSVERFD